MKVGISISSRLNAKKEEPVKSAVEHQRQGAALSICIEDCEAESIVSLVPS